MPHWIQNYTPLFGRILIGGFFIWNGVQSILHLPSTIEIFSSAGTTYGVWLAIVAAFVQVVCGIGLVAGFRTRLSAAALAVYVICASVFLFDTNATAGIHLFLQRMAIVGGLLYIVAYGSGKWSTDQS